ncbi:MAG: SDR family NAD(P)-dependent oxidoreductase, partial [Geminicoccaceae bacterium]
KVAVVTGAACGIGRATATAFLEEGARTALADIDQTALRESHRGLAGHSSGKSCARRFPTRPGWPGLRRFPRTTRRKL